LKFAVTGKFPSIVTVIICALPCCVPDVHVAAEASKPTGCKLAAEPFQRIAKLVL